MASISISRDGVCLDPSVTLSARPPSLAVPETGLKDSQNVVLPAHPQSNSSLERSLAQNEQVRAAWDAIPNVDPAKLEKAEALLNTPGWPTASDLDALAQKLITPIGE